MKTYVDDILFSMVTKFSDFTRNQGVFLARPELLSEHLVEVQLIGYQMIKYMKYKGISNRFDERLFLEKALFHDLDEVVTGDIPRNTKYHSVEGKQALDKVAEDALTLIESHYDYLKGIKDLALNAKKGREGIILAVADMLSVYRRVMIEIEIKGNKSPLRIVKELTSHVSLLEGKIEMLSDLTQEEKAFLQETLKDAETHCRSIVEENKNLIEKYSFIENKLSIYEKESN